MVQIVISCEILISRLVCAYIVFDAWMCAQSACTTAKQDRRGNGQGPHEASPRREGACTSKIISCHVNPREQLDFHACFTCSCHQQIRIHKRVRIHHALSNTYPTLIMSWSSHYPDLVLICSNIRLDFHACLLTLTMSWSSHYPDLVLVCSNNRCTTPRAQITEISLLQIVPACFPVALAVREKHLCAFCVKLLCALCVVIK